VSIKLNIYCHILNLRTDACFFIEVSGQFMILHSEELCDLYRSPGVLWWAVYVARMEHMQNF
jgi:hypothetical protein